MTRPLSKITSRVVPLVRADVDTDQIIPARFLKVTTREGLGAHLFDGWRGDPGFVLNRPETAGCEVLLAGANFGCGSSREHAVWALCDFGFRAVVAPSFADIFKGNAVKNGLLPVAIDPGAHERLVAACERDPRATVTVDLAARTLSFGTDLVDFPIDPFARRCLLEGIDELDYLLSLEPRIAAWEARHG